MTIVFRHGKKRERRALSQRAASATHLLFPNYSACKLRKDYCKLRKTYCKVRKAYYKQVKDDMIEERYLDVKFDNVVHVDLSCGRQNFYPCDLINVNLAVKMIISFFRQLDLDVSTKAKKR